MLSKRLLVLLFLSKSLAVTPFLYLCNVLWEFSSKFIDKYMRVQQMLELEKGLIFLIKTTILGVHGTSETVSM